MAKQKKEKWPWDTKKKRVNLSIDPEINERWNKVAKKFKWSKSGMVEDFLRDVLPDLEEIDVDNILSQSVKSISKKLEKVAETFEEVEKKNKK